MGSTLLVLFSRAASKPSGLLTPPEVNGSFRGEVFQRVLVCIQDEEVGQGIVTKSGSLGALEEVNLGESSLKLTIRHRQGEKKGCKAKKV